jgi:hypothetical protein
MKKEPPLSIFILNIFIVFILSRFNVGLMKGLPILGLFEFSEVSNRAIFEDLPMGLFIVLDPWNRCYNLS